MTDWPKPLYTTLHREKPGGCYFDEEAAEDAVKFFGLLRHTIGRWGQGLGQPFVLEPWQQHEVIRPLFGWKLADGTRLYRQLYLEIPRKNGKSTLSAGLAGKLLYADREPAAEVYSAAADKEQAKIVFKQLGDMVNKSPALRKRTRPLQYSLFVDRTNSSYKVLSREVKTKWGFNVHGVVYDELHAAPDRELFDALVTATGAREQPLIVLISTAGYDRTSICWEQHEHTIQVAKGMATDNSLLGVIYAADEKDDWTTPETWWKANPNLGVTISERFLAEECEKAKSLPAYQNTFRRLYLNQWTSQDVRLFPMEDYDEGPTEVFDWESMRGRPCFGGLDLASTTDLASFSLAFPPQDEKEPVKILNISYTPQEQLRDRGLRDRGDYEVWQREGFLKTTPGKTIDQDYIKADVLRAAEYFQLQDVSYDRWQAAQIVRELEDEGIVMVMMGQGYASMSSPIKATLQYMLDHRLATAGNKLLRWCFDNVAGEMDAAGNLKPNKAKSSGRIDAAVATIMGIDGMTRRWVAEPEASVYSYLLDRSE